MSKFSKKDISQPVVSSASLPDIVFILLFFFMTVTVIKDKNLMVENTLPNASETKDLGLKDRIIYIHIGKPIRKLSATHGTEPKIQIDNRLLELAEVGAYIIGKREQLPEHVKKKLTVSLKIDKNANMGLVTDLKKELRKVRAYKVNYTTYDGDVLDNL